MVGVVTVSMVLATALVAAAGTRVAVMRSQGAADAAAVAGAAAAVGLVRGGPCAAADRTARGNGARVSSCDVADAVVRVRVHLRSGPFDVEAVALAGPPTTDALTHDPDIDPAGIPVTVCMVCLSARRSSMSRSTRTRPRPRADSTIDQGVTCQARRSS